tara:strand:- start:242 stop:874 length:633 start_codon:yes stop_codon:yes gene_type:complete
MTVLYKKLKITISFLLLLIILGCDSKDYQGETYSVLSAVTKELSFKYPVPPPPMPINISEEDSILILNNHKKIMDTFKDKKQIIAIIPYATPAYLDSFDDSDLSKEFQILIKKLISNDKKTNYHIPNIKSRESDSIIILTDELLKSNPNDWRDFDLSVNFSNVSFNEKRNLAVVVGSVSTGSRSGFSGIYFLRKIKGKWAIIKQEGLSIS